MAANNLRIIYNNLADVATITASAAAMGVTAIANVKKDSKSLVCRTAGTSITFTVTLAALSIVGGVILPFCNLTAGATMGITLLNGASTVYNSGTVLCCPYQNLGGWDWGAIPLGVNGYAYGRGTYARVWIPTQTSCTSMTIVITDTENTAGFLEFSRFVIGGFWSPKYNTEYGLSYQQNELSTHERTEAGDLVSNKGIRYGSMNFDMKWLVPADRLQMTTILKGGGITNPLLISLFPDNSADWAQEQTFMIYGKMPQMANVSHPLFGVYTTSIDIEEI